MPDDSQPKQSSPALKIVLIVIAALLACTAVVFLLLGIQGAAHSKYATGSHYTVEGRIVNVEKKTNPNRSHSYRIELVTDEALPDGTKTYESVDSGDFQHLEKYKDDHVSTFVFTISDDGHIMDVAPKGSGLAGDVSGKDDTSVGNPSNGGDDVSGTSAGGKDEGADSGGLEGDGSSDPGNSADANDKDGRVNKYLKNRAAEKGRQSNENEQE